MDPNTWYNIGTVLTFVFVAACVVFAAVYFFSHVILNRKKGR